MSGQFQCNFCPALSYTCFRVGSPILSHPHTMWVWLCSQVSLLVHLGALSLSLSLSGFFASPTSATPKYTLSTTNKRLSCLILFARAFSSLSSSRCLWYWMSSYPSSRPLLPLISFEALQSSAVFCHSRHTSNFLICVGYHQNNISISKTNYPHHIPISKNLLDHTMIYQWQKVIVIVPAAITPDLFFQPRLCQAAKRDLGFKSRWICMSSSQSN